MTLLAVSLDRSGRVTFANEALLSLLAAQDGELTGLDWYATFAPDAERRDTAAAFHEAMDGGAMPARSVSTLQTPAGGRRTIVWHNVVLRDASRVPVGAASIGEDVTERQRLEVEHGRLVAAVGQASESIVITDTSGAILYVNPAFERTSGYGRDEVAGANPRILRSGHQSSAYYEAMWRRLAAGMSWSGEFVNRRKDGSLYRAETTISPVRDETGDTTSYVAVQRDVTQERAIEAEHERRTRERAQVTAALGRLRADAAPEETAAAVCTEVVALPGVEFASIISFAGPRVAIPLAVESPPGTPLEVGRPLPSSRAAYLFKRAGQGPWAERWQARPEDRRYGRSIAEAGTLVAAYAPLRDGSELLGVLAIGTGDSAEAEQFAERLPAAVEFGAIATVLLAPWLRGRRREADVRAEVERIIASRALAAVFQPIFDLASGAVVGWEALTRFANGVRPDQQLAQAHAVGLGLELEELCVEVALEAADALPDVDWVSINAAPSFIIEVDRLARLLAPGRRPIVLEVTEHAAILDYVEIRAALARLGERVRLSVDDAGAGYASLHHIVELRPHFVKLDRSLVARVDRDPVRQALITGLRYFALISGCELVAEGVETAEELEMLRSLEITLGQGYLLGEPAPATAWRGAPARPVPGGAVRSPGLVARRGGGAKLYSCTSE